MGLLEGLRAGVRVRGATSVFEGTRRVGGAVGGLEAGLSADYSAGFARMKNCCLSMPAGTATSKKPTIISSLV